MASAVFIQEVDSWIQFSSLTWQKWLPIGKFRLYIIKACCYSQCIAVMSSGPLIVIIVLDYINICEIPVCSLLVCSGYSSEKFKIWCLSIQKKSTENIVFNTPQRRCLWTISCVSIDTQSTHAVMQTVEAQFPGYADVGIKCGKIAVFVKNWVLSTLWKWPLNMHKPAICQCVGLHRGEKRHICWCRSHICNIQLICVALYLKLYSSWLLYVLIIFWIKIF